MWHNVPLGSVSEQAPHPGSVHVQQTWVGQVNTYVFHNAWDIGKYDRCLGDRFRHIPAIPRVYLPYYV